MLLSILLGLFLGVVSGILPGLGSASILLITLPFLITLEPLSILMTYLALVISSQYVASVTAIYTGIPGAESAAPTAKEFANITTMGLTRLAIFQNAQSSIIGNLIGVGLFLAMVPLLNDLASVYKSAVKVGILVVAYTAIVLTAERRLQALGLVVLGSWLMVLGFNPHSFTTVDLGLQWLSEGLPWVALVMGSLIGASVSELTSSKEPVVPVATTKTSPYIASVIRGGTLGFVVGFIPGLSYVLSSLMSYSLERRLLYKSPKHERVLGSIAASESAQSSGTVAMLVPLLVFAIPITASEAVILNIVTLHTSLRSVLDQLLDQIEYVIASLIAVNVISYFLALRTRSLVVFFFKIPSHVLQISLLVLGAVAVYASVDSSHILAFSTYFLTLVFFNLTRFNPLPFIMAVLLFTTTQSNYYLFKALYS